MRVLPIALVLLSACSVHVETQATSESSPDKTRPEPSLDESEEPALPPSPEPIESFLAHTGSVTWGILTVKTEVIDGEVYCNCTREIVEDENNRREISEGRVIARDLAASWFVYAHTSHELYLFDGKGTLVRSTLEQESFVKSTSHHQQLAGGDTWNPSAELLQDLPPKLVAKIDESVAGR